MFLLKSQKTPLFVMTWSLGDSEQARAFQPLFPSGITTNWTLDVVHGIRFVRQIVDFATDFARIFARINVTPGLTLNPKKGIGKAFLKMPDFLIHAIKEGG